MDVSARAGFPASPSGNSSPVLSSDQQLADQLVNAAAKGDAHQVIRAVAANGLNILSKPHSETGNTALHAAIQNRHVEVVGAVTGLLVQPTPSSTVNLRKLLDLKNNENHSPLEVGGLTPEIKTELLPCLSDLWPFCSAHKGYIVFPYQQECGCRVCELCSNNVKSDVECATCSEYLNTKDTTPDYGPIAQAKRIIRKYPALFDEAGLPVCPNCIKQAFPPFESQCGHVLCYTCVSKTDKTCQAKLDDSDNLCQQPLKSMHLDEGASQRYIRLFSSQTQYGDCSALGQPIREAMNRPSTSAERVEATQAADVSTAHADTTVINGITVENCPHLPDQPDRYAVPASDRIHKKYSDDVALNLKIEELEYRLEFSSEKIAAKLDKALANARAQQEAEQKKKEQRVILRPTDDDEQLSQSDDSEYEAASDSSQESLSSGFCSMLDTETESITVMLEAAEQNEPENPEDEGIDIISQSDENDQQEESDSLLEYCLREFNARSETLSDQTTAALGTERAIAHTQEAVEHVAAEQNEPESSEDEDISIISQSDKTDQQEAAEQQATTQHVIAQPTEDDEGILALSGDFVGQWLASGHSWGAHSSLYYTMSETSPAPITAVPEPEPTNAQRLQEEQQEESPVQRVIEQSLDDIETPAMSADPDLLPYESYATPEMLHVPITVPPATEPTPPQTQQEVPQAAPEQHMIAQPAESIEPPALSNGAEPLEAIDSWQPVLPPVSCKMSETLPGVSIASSIGLRPTMEDAHIATHFTIKAGGEDVPISIFGVFDGHGTKEVADHAAQNIVKFLTKWLELYNAESLTDERIWNAIKIALVDLSRSSHCVLGGSTACIGLIIKNELWIANLGDSRAILVNRNGEVIQLSEDAKPENEIYKTSIEKRGGFVGNALGIYRVNNNLAPARALADHHLNGAVCSRAKIARYPLTDFSGCLVLVCDGVTEVFTTKEIADITREALNENAPDINIADMIVKRSLAAYTTDNVSAVVAPLGGA